MLTMSLYIFLDNARNPTREQFASILNGQVELSPVVIPNLFPKFLEITNKGQATFVKELESKELSH